MKRIFKFKQTLSQLIEVEASSEEEAREKIERGQYVRHRPTVLNTSLETGESHGIEIKVSTGKPCCPACFAEINLTLAEIAHKNADNEICHQCSTPYNWERLGTYCMYYSMELKGDEQD